MRVKVLAISLLVCGVPVIAKNHHTLTIDSVLLRAAYTVCLAHKPVIHSYEASKIEKIAYNTNNLLTTIYTSKPLHIELSGPLTHAPQEIQSAGYKAIKNVTTWTDSILFWRKQQSMWLTLPRAKKTATKCKVFRDGEKGNHQFLCHKPLGMSPEKLLLLSLVHKGSLK